MLQIHAAEAKIVGSRCNDDGIKTLSFVKLQSPHYYYEPPSNVSLGSEPLNGMITFVAHDMN